MNNSFSHPRRRELARVGSMMSLAASLAACGGGSSSPPAASPPPPAPAPASATATLASPSDGKFAWRVAQPASVTLTDASGHAVAASATSCAAHDATQVTVSADCSQVTALRVGPLTIDVSGGGASASLVVHGVPQRHWAGAHGASRYAALTVADDGSVAAWGDNDNHLFDAEASASGAFIAAATPAMSVAGTPWAHVVQASMGEDSAIVLFDDGTAQAWGDDSSRQLGADSTNAAPRGPVAVDDLTARGSLQHVVQVETGEQNAVALIDDGSVLGWGSYAGNGTGNNDLLPVQVVGPDGVTPLSHVGAVSAGWNFALALTDDGRVLSWGFDPGAGALGQGASAGQVAKTPGYVVRADGTPLDGIVQVSAGYNFCLALAADGSVWSWGSNSDGQLGRGTIGGSSAVAVQVQAAGGGNLSRIAMVAAGGWHALALDLDGRVLAWGVSSSGELGDGAGAPVFNDTGVPHVTVSESGSVAGFTDIVSIAASYSDSYALGRDGRVLSWGRNFNGALGRTTTGPDDRTPARVATSTGTLALTATAYPNLLRRAR